MGDYAQTSDIAIDYGPLDGAAQEKAALNIARAEARIRREIPDLEARVDAGLIDKVLVSQVVCEMVISVLRNPQGLRSFTQTAGPFTGSQTFADGASGQLDLTDRQRGLLGLTPSGDRGFTITPGPARSPFRPRLPPPCW